MVDSRVLAWCAAALAVSLQGCATLYRHDVAGNTTCVSYGIPQPSMFTVAPPVITNSGEELGCPRRVLVGIEAANRDDAIHYTIAESPPRADLPPTLASPLYERPISVVLNRRGSVLYVQAVAVDACGAVSNVANGKYGCTGTYLAAPSVSHWFDFPFPWPGKRPYDDVVYEGAQLPAGCVVTGIKVDLLDRNDTVVGVTDPGSLEATDGNTGVNIKAYKPNSQQLELKINSWHLFGFRVRYSVSYSVRGTNCVLPPFVYRTE